MWDKRISTCIYRPFNNPRGICDLSVFTFGTKKKKNVVEIVHTVLSLLLNSLFGDIVLTRLTLIWHIPHSRILHSSATL